MDPNLFDKINALQNYQNQQSNQANLQQLKANQQQLKANQGELKALRRQLAEEANKPQCPHCGGRCEKGFDRCKNCSQELIWDGQFVGKPGQEGQLEVAMKEYRLGIERQQQADREQSAAERRRAQERIDKARKEWETTNPGHKWEDRFKVAAEMEKVTARNHAYFWLAFVVFVIFIIWINLF
jgi:hypothetical protein